MHRGGIKALIIYAILSDNVAERADIINVEKILPSHCWSILSSNVVLFGRELH